MPIDSLALSKKYLYITTMIETEVAYKVARQIVKNEGIFIGMSSGAAIYAAANITKNIASGIIVTIFPDRWRKILEHGIVQEIKGKQYW